MQTPIDAQVLNAFLQPALELLRLYVSESAISELRLADELPPPPGVAVSVRLRGRLVGRIVCTFDARVARALAGGMGVEPSAVVTSPECLDALGELANMMVGHAAGELLEAGYQVDVLPPQSAPLDGTSQAPREKAVDATLRTPAGDVRMIFQLRPSALRLTS